MAELGSRRIEEALAALASPREPAAAGVASAFTAAAAAALVELAAALAANKIAAAGPGCRRRWRTGCARWRSRPASFGSACSPPATRMRGPTLRSPGPGRDATRRGRWIEPASLRSRSRRLPLRSPSGPPRWPRPETGRSPPTRSLPGSCAAAAARGCAQLVEANLAGDPEDPRPARARAAADLAAQASRTRPSIRRAEGPRTWLRSPLCPGHRWWTWRRPRCVSGWPPAARAPGIACRPRRSWPTRSASLEGPFAWRWSGWRATAR